MVKIHLYLTNEEASERVQVVSESSTVTNMKHEFMLFALSFMLSDTCHPNFQPLLHLILIHVLVSTFALTFFPHIIRTWLIINFCSKRKIGRESSSMQSSWMGPVLYTVLPALLIYISPFSLAHKSSHHYSSLVVQFIYFSVSRIELKMSSWSLHTSNQHVVK